MKKIMPYLKYGCSFIVGGLSVLAYAPFEYALLMPICIAYLYYQLSFSKLNVAMRHAFAFGFAQFGFGVSWVYVSMHTFGNMPPLMAGFAVVLFVAVIALYFILLAYSFNKLKSNNLLLNALAFASIWVLVEWLRGYLFTGFPWLDIGYTQTTQWLSGYAAIGGIYLVSFVTVLISALIVNAFLSFKLNKTITATALFISCLVSFGGAQLLSIQWSESKGNSQSIGLIQANIPIDKKWRPDFRAELIARYQQLSPNDTLDLLVFPETAMPVYRHNVPQEFWNSFGDQHGGVISGITELDPLTKQVYNSAVVNCSATEQVYRKQHLVPFGEYLPLRALFSWVLDYLQLPMSDFSAWQGKQAIECNGLKISLSICYEDAFSSKIANNLVDGEVLINISEDAWFGRSIAPHQRQQMAQMRAQETARPILRGSNTGPSTFVSYKGEILQETPMFKQQVLIAEVQPRVGETPYVKYGLWIIILSGLFSAGLVIKRYMSSKKESI